jgi:hypothetical protein
MENEIACGLKLRKNPQVWIGSGLGCGVVSVSGDMVLSAVVHRIHIHDCIGS